jgi:hypothetical protein
MSVAAEIKPPTSDVSFPASEFWTVSLRINSKSKNPKGTQP